MIEETGLELVPVLDVASLEAISGLVTDALPGSAHTRRAYRSQLKHFMKWFAANPGRLDKARVRAYLVHMAQDGKTPTVRNQALAVIKKLATEAADNGYLSFGTSDAINRIKASPQSGRQTGNWLTLEEAQSLISEPDTRTLAGKRDRVMLGLLLECGLRREEAVEVDVEQIQTRDHRTLIANLDGKGGKFRTVPVPARLSVKIADWIEASGIDGGRLLRPVNKADRIEGESMSSTAAYKRVIQYAKTVGVTSAPHDLRRTFGRLAHKAGAPIEQIQATFGHSNQRTTELYLGLMQDLDDPPCDMLDIEDGTMRGGRNDDSD